MRIAVLLIALLLAACGQRADLKPAAGNRLPPAPYGRDEPKTAEALLVPSTQAIPERSIELRKRSEERADDPFDIPPEE